MNTLQEQVIEQEHESFKVTDLSTATWAMRKIAAHKQKIAEIDCVAQEQIDQVKQWQTKESESHTSAIEYLESLLIAFYQEERANNPKAKVSTQYGAVKSRTAKKWNYDEQSVIDWAKANGKPFVRVKESLDKTALKKAFPVGVDAETGEVIPGIEIEEQTTYKVEVK